MSWNQVLNARYVNRGASGATAMTGAKRFAIVGNVGKKVSRAGGDALPANAWKTGGAPVVFVETENSAEAIAAITAADLEEQLVLGYERDDGNRKYTVASVKCVGPNDQFNFPPKEEDGNVPTVIIQFDVVQGTSGNTTLAAAIVESSDP